MEQPMTHSIAQPGAQTGDPFNAVPEPADTGLREENHSNGAANDDQYEARRDLADAAARPAPERPRDGYRRAEHRSGRQPIDSAHPARLRSRNS